MRASRLVDERTRIDDRLVRLSSTQIPQQNLSPAIERLFADAGETSATLDVGRVIRRSRFQLYGAAALGSVLVFAAVLKWGPKEISEGVAQLVVPTTLAADSKALSIKVRPGTARVPKGSDQDIIATLINFDSRL